MTHHIKAYHNNNLIASFFRDSSDINLDVMYRILNLEKFFDNKSDSENKTEVGENEIYEAPDLSKLVRKAKFGDNFFEIPRHRHSHSYFFIVDIVYKPSICYLFTISNESTNRYLCCYFYMLAHYKCHKAYQYM